MPLSACFVRHGESHANLDHVFANRVDYLADLTPTGEAQARQLASALSHREITHLYTSPLPRAVQTADIIATTLGLPVVTSTALREYDVGDFEGTSYKDDDAWRLRRYEHVERCWRQGERDVRHPGGESLDDLVSRFMPFMELLATRHAATDALVLVGHGGLYRAVLPQLFSTISPGYALLHPLGHTAAVRARYLEAEWQCLQWGNDRFLLDTVRDSQVGW